MARDDDRRSPGAGNTGRHRALTTDAPGSGVRSNLSDRVAYLQGALAVSDVRLSELEKDMTALQKTLEELKETNAKMAGALTFAKWLLGAVGVGNIIALILWVAKGH